MPNCIKNWEDRLILIAEDDVINFNLLSIMLRPTRIKVIWAKNGLEAVNYFKENSNIDIILMDIQMPVLDGNEAANQIREMDMKVPIVVISAYTSVDVRQRAKEVGTNEFINKPVQSTLLIDVIEKYICP
jgi:CheY-like chemotaxis protein